MSTSMPPVLIAGDEAPIRDMICMLLEDEGFSCLQAANGEQALLLLRARTERVVVLLDLMMPCMTGKDVLDVVAADPALAGRHRFILVTAADKTLSLALVQQLQQLRVPLVRKPFNIDHLVNVVMQAAQQLDNAVLTPVPVVSHGGQGLTTNN